jgi:hypothetical protein
VGLGAVRVEIVEALFDPLDTFAKADQLLPELVSSGLFGVDCSLDSGKCCGDRSRFDLDTFETLGRSVEVRVRLVSQSLDSFLHAVDPTFEQIPSAHDLVENSLQQRGPFAPFISHRNILPRNARAGPEGKFRINPGTFRFRV